MSDEPNAPKKKKGKGKKIMLLMGAVLLLGGGGAGAALYASGSSLLGGGHKAAEPDLPKLVVREGVSASEAARYFSPTGEKRPDPSKFQASYHLLGENFTSNLSDSSGFVQLALGVSTYYDERVIENAKRHEMAIRSAVLLTLSEQDQVSLSSQGGKEALKASLRKAINDVLKSRENFGGIDDVHFTSFVIQ